jgi:hypothetical protein
VTSPPLPSGPRRHARRVLGRAALALLATSVVAALVVVGPVSGWWWGVAWAGFPIVGALILWRRPRNTMGWLLLLTGACYAIALSGYQLIGPSPGRGPVWFELAVELGGYLGWICLIAIVVLFPTGRAETRATQWLIRLTMVAAAAVVTIALVNPAPLEASGRTNPLAVPALAAFAGWFIDDGFVIVPLLMLGALISLIVRWRGSSGVERLQYRWFVLSVAIAVGMVFFSNFVGQIDGVQALAFALGMNAVPIAIGIAVTRYRLYEIDRVVSRTTSYIVVTGVLLGVYAVVVTAVSRLLPGTSNSLSVAAATLAAAAMFRPLLTRVQAVVDRRFNRSRFDAQRTVETFAARLRDEVSTEQVSADLVVALRQTLQPSGVNLWLRGDLR